MGSVGTPCFSEEYANEGLIFLRVRKSDRECSALFENKGVSRILFAKSLENSEVAENAGLMGLVKLVGVVV
jgi:hypothetical protein